YQAAQYCRIAKGGREVWIQASYNPILDAAGRPYKVIKYATDITQQVQLLDQLRRITDENFAEIETALGQSSRQVSDVAAASGQTSDNVNPVAAAAEELAASVQNIAQSMAQSRTATDQAFEHTKSASEFTDKLSNAATAMGGIVALIQNIAGQINL